MADFDADRVKVRHEYATAFGGNRLDRSELVETATCKPAARSGRNSDAETKRVRAIVLAALDRRPTGLTPADVVSRPATISTPARSSRHSSESERARRHLERIA